MTTQTDFLGLGTLEWTIIICTVCLIIALVRCSVLISMGNKPKKWEYRLIWGYGYSDHIGDSTPDTLGREGWELVTVNLINKNDKELDSRFYEGVYKDSELIEHCAFKRQLPD